MKKLKLVFLSAIALSLFAGGVLFAQTGARSGSRAEVPDVGMVSDETAAAVAEAVEKISNREQVQTYTVQKGDTLVSIANDLWGDPRLWPDLYAMNKDKINNPYFIVPGMKLKVFDRLGKGGTLSEAEVTFLLASFGEVYKRFETMGEKYVWPRRWILNQASYFDAQFVERFASQIEQSDLDWYRNMGRR